MGQGRNLFAFTISSDGGLKIIDGPPILAEDSIILVVDEDYACNWLFIGSNTTLIHRRAGMRAANFVRRLGYPLNNSVIGNKCKEFIIIDVEEGAEIRQSKIQQLKSILTRPPPKPVFKTPVETPRIKSPDFRSETIIRPIEELKGRINSSTQSCSSEKLYEAGYRRLGVLLASILLTYNDIRITREAERYMIDAANTRLCSVKVKGDRLIVAESSTFGGVEEKYNIQKRFIRLMEKARKLFGAHS